MSILKVEGSHRLEGEITVQAAKNSVLPILAATLLCSDVCVIENCPHLRDVDASIRILEHLGCHTVWTGSKLTIDTSSMGRCDIPESMMREMRSSVIFLGAILARQGEAELSYPGGCELGPRPIDLHILALRLLQAEIEDFGALLRCRAGTLHGTEVVLPIPSVGATENILLAACGAKGTTTIYNAAREPEILDLQSFLVAMGAKVYGAGSSVITVEGGMPLHGCSYHVMGDRIAAATYLGAVAIAGGSLLLKGMDYRPLSPMCLALAESGCHVENDKEHIFIESNTKLCAIRPISTAPYPGFPTDAQPLLMAALLCSSGSTIFVENIFESRYRHVDELIRMGSDIRVAGRVAVVNGVQTLCGARVECADLRGGAALVIAALAAQGVTCIGHIEYIDRGYESIENTLSSLGAHIVREE